MSGLCESAPLIQVVCTGIDYFGTEARVQAQDAAQNFAESAFAEFARWAGEAAGNLLVDAMTWWVTTPTVNPENNAVQVAQEWTIPIVSAMLMISVLWQCGRLLLLRKKEPLINIGMGLIRYFLIATLSLMVIAGAIQAGDALATAMVDDAAKDFGERMQGLMTVQILGNPFGLALMAILLFFASLIQWVIGFMRQAGILILAAMIPLAASGSLNDSTKTWWPRLAVTLLALVAYKPACAFIYLIGFTLMGEGKDISTVLTGMMVLFLSIFALPAMLKFFSWAETQVAGGRGGGGGAFLGAAGAVAMAGGRGGGGGGGGSSPAASASAMQSTGPGSQGGGAGSFNAVAGANPPAGAAASSQSGGDISAAARSDSPASGAGGSGRGAAASAAGSSAPSSASASAGGGASASSAAGAGPAGAAIAAGQAAHQAGQSAAAQVAPPDPPQSGGQSSSSGSSSSSAPPPPPPPPEPNGPRGSQP